jgi:hypothetical protein
MSDIILGESVKKSPFKLLRGSRILLKRPVKKESSLTMDATTEKQLELEMMQKWTRLEVYAVGTAVEDTVVGDKVYISMDTITNAAVIHLGVEDMYLMIREQDISIIW